MMCNRKWHHQWSDWVLVSFAGTTFTKNRRHCERCGFTQERATG